MQIIKYIILFLILVISSFIGRLLSKKYVYRLDELEEIKNALNILKTKIKFSYEPIPDIFEEISKTNVRNIAIIFKSAKDNMNNMNASTAWTKAIENSPNNLKSEDKKVLKSLSKLLGQTDAEGQVSQIEITESFLENQINDAMKEKTKNEKLYTRLGTILGLAIVIILC